MRRLLLLLVPLTLLAAACGGDGHDMGSMGADGDPSPAMPGGGHGMGHDADGDVPDGARTIEVTASSFEFDPARIEVAAGEPIAIELSATDAEHDFVIDDVDVHVVAAGAGETRTGGFTAPEAGEYPYYCSVAGHRAAGMEGTLVVS